MLASASAIAGASVVAVIAAGGTYALWSDARAVPGATIQAGTLGLTVNGVSSYALSGAAWSKLLPGDVVSQQVTLKNTGNVPGTITAGTHGSFAPLLVHIKKGTCGAAIGGTSSTVSPTNLGILAAGEASVVCIQVTMPSTAAASVQGAAQSFSVDFTSTTGS
jgi:predicted ribosomally synthesized peptide with SipW-like signal peptide